MELPGAYSRLKKQRGIRSLGLTATMSWSSVGAGVRTRMSPGLLLASYFFLFTNIPSGGYYKLGHRPSPHSLPGSSTHPRPRPPLRHSPSSSPFQNHPHPRPSQPNPPQYLTRKRTHPHSFCSLSLPPHDRKFHQSLVRTSPISTAGVKRCSMPGAMHLDH